MTPEDLARLQEIEARVERATPGRWRAHRNSWEYCSVYDGPDHGALIATFQTDADCGEEDVSERAMPDAEFCAHAREDVPWLIGRVKHLEEMNDRQGDALDWSALEIKRLGGRQVPNDVRRKVAEVVDALWARVEELEGALRTISDGVCMDDVAEYDVGGCNGSCSKLADAILSAPTAPAKGGGK